MNKLRLIQKPLYVCGGSKGFLIKKKDVDLDLDKYYEITIKEAEE